VESLGNLQKIFDDNDLFPTYLVDYQVAKSDSAADVLSGILKKGRCEIGAHLHPWNTPPLEEAATPFNSMLCNLERSLQARKLQSITELLRSRFGAHPRVFRAGRWGFGVDTARSLIECGYLIDTSVTPFMSWKNDHGPSYVGAPVTPYFLGDGDVCTPAPRGDLLEVPVSIGFNRWPFDRCAKFRRILEMNPIRLLRIVGFAHRTGILKKAWLSPENMNLEDMASAAKVMIRHGVRILNMNLHSNSFMNGLGPFASRSGDAERIAGKLYGFIRFLRGIAKIKPIALSRVRELVAAGSE
jgi:hypothetical protein